MTTAWLSIPFTLDFSLHLQTYAGWSVIWAKLSIPFTWDFSLHLNSAAGAGTNYQILSIPFTWDFSLHHHKNSWKMTVKASSFNSLYLGFFLASVRVVRDSRVVYCYFQFPLLGIFPCIEPEAWSCFCHNADFQFPLLGIFPCIELRILIVLNIFLFLSIPFTWDFSLHRFCCWWLPRSLAQLSIPFTWDFSLHHYCNRHDLPQKLSPFNSLYLGFFLASKIFDADPKAYSKFFQFPLLGIFPCIMKPNYIATSEEAKQFFQFPLLGIFPCILCPLTPVIVKVLFLSIPFTWDFSLHLLSTRMLNSATSWYFQFPLLGIFPCIAPMKPLITTAKALPFQFPLLGIFPCIFAEEKWILRVFPELSIPFTWDFSLHHQVCHFSGITRSFSFNSLYLGFFLASLRHLPYKNAQGEFFQFPLLGIFPCIL